MKKTFSQKLGHFLKRLLIEFGWYLVSLVCFIIILAISIFGAGYLFFEMGIG